MEDGAVRGMSVSLGYLCTNFTLDLLVKGEGYHAKREKTHKRDMALDNLQSIQCCSAAALLSLAKMPFNFSVNAVQTSPPSSPPNASLSTRL
jgi:hypothetical protein